MCHVILLLWLFVWYDLSAKCSKHFLHSVNCLCYAGWNCLGKLPWLYRCRGAIWWLETEWIGSGWREGRYNRCILFVIVFCNFYMYIMYSAFRKSLCTYKRCLKWCAWASIQAWTSLILFANNFCRSAFGKSLCTFKTCWKWCRWASVQAWTHLILFANTFRRSVFRKSLCTYKRCWKWCPQASIQAWTRLILSANTFHRSVFRKSLCTYKRCWKWCPQHLYRPEPI
jgi:hypothetical protein